MSRSRRKNPFGPITSIGSEKQAKRFANRRMRRIVNHRISSHWCDDDLLMPTMDEVANLYDFPSDGGKRWCGFLVDDYLTPLEFFKEYIRK